MSQQTQTMLNWLLVAPLQHGRALFQTRAVAGVRLAALPITALSLAVLSACGGADAAAPSETAQEMPAGDLEPTESSTPELTTPEPGLYGGNYFVPVPDELVDYADFAIGVIEVRMRGSELELRYDLPALLVGETRGVSFRGELTRAARGEPSQFVLEGDDGRATCAAQDGIWRCDEVLRDVQPDLSKIEQELADLTEPEAAGRRAVAERFAVDPIGVLSFDMTP